MATIHIDAHKNKGDLSNFIEQGVARRLQLDGASEGLRSHIRVSIEEKANGMFLWANLMLEILKWQTTEDDIRDSLRTAPAEIDDMITETLKVYSSLLKGREAEEFNTILAWLSCSARPLTLAEVDAALRRLSPSASKVLSLEHRLRTTYATLLNVIRDDGLSTASLQSQTTAIRHNSIPETTTVTFSHATIAEFFRKDPGKFARRKTAVSIGVVRLEAELSLLSTCLRVFLEPGDSDWLASSLALQSYAKESWYYHIQNIGQLTTPKHVENPEDSSNKTKLVSHVAKVIRMLHNFLEEEDIVREWSRDMPWEFFDEAKCATIAKFIAGMSDEPLRPRPSSTMSWVSRCTEQSETIFLSVAKVHAKHGLHGDWFPLPALKVVAQIRAIAEADDTLDTLPAKLPHNTILKAAYWAELERNASWNRKIAICLRNSGHVSQAILYFEGALKLDPDHVCARTGLATAYKNQGYLNKAIDLELTNTKILTRLIGEEEENVALYRKDLCDSYEAVARVYRTLENTKMALKYWRKAAETGHIGIWAIHTYLEDLSEVSDETKWEEIWRLLHALTAYILENMWPENFPTSFFVLSGTAARQVGSLEWLEGAYNTAIAAAATKSHMSVLILKLSLARLFIEYMYDFTRAEPLVEEIMEISSVIHPVSLQDLEKCKKACSKDFCHIIIRQALQSGTETVEHHQLRRVVKLLKSGIEPSDVTQKIIWGEKSLVIDRGRDGNTGAVHERMYGPHAGNDTTAAGKWTVDVRHQPPCLGSE
ncbi:hypothetical protein BDU57DRAFT_585975 [Ampelomyces quisqualis]|uniref:Uncharacterized protein n=1 Tax=Ampelomyces quisqualis TaxID=50730 RepID=A0A6A5QVY9_AMPQU|nr:hypothetical protein BDU57DRAFT_585975 [Ampelomyces quisqualis]